MAEDRNTRIYFYNLQQIPQRSSAEFQIQTTCNAERRLPYLPVHIQQQITWLWRDLAETGISVLLAYLPATASRNNTVFTDKGVIYLRAKFRSVYISTQHPDSFDEFGRSCILDVPDFLIRKPGVRIMETSKQGNTLLDIWNHWAEEELYLVFHD